MQEVRLFPQGEGFWALVRFAQVLRRHGLSETERRMPLCSYWLGYGAGRFDGRMAVIEGRR